MAFYTKWAVRIRWLDRNNKWHSHTTKWYGNSGEAWAEADSYKTPTEWLERKETMLHN